jgi:hypothetical protein
MQLAPPEYVGFKQLGCITGEFNALLVPIHLQRVTQWSLPSEKEM